MIRLKTLCDPIKINEEKKMISICQYQIYRPNMSNCRCHIAKLSPAKFQLSFSLAWLRLVLFSILQPPEFVHADDLIRKYMDNYWRSIGDGSLHFYHKSDDICTFTKNSKVVDDY